MGEAVVSGAGRRPTRQREDTMSQNDEWSPDQPSGSHPFEQGDEALDEKTELDPSFLEAVELDPSLDPTLQADERELEEVGAEFDDPEAMATLDGGIDDPDGMGGPVPGTAADEEGWDLDAPVTAGDVDTDPT
jgi:hypothetical protein